VREGPHGEKHSRVCVSCVGCETIHTWYHEVEYRDLSDTLHILMGTGPHGEKHPGGCESCRV